MPALFNAKASFSIPGRRLFVISGDIVSGVVKKGMTMKLRMNSSFALSLPIEGVEFVTKKEGSEVGLTTLCHDGDELSMLQALSISGEQIEIEDTEQPEANKITTDNSGASPLCV